jgi:hypothetical protein
MTSTSRTKGSKGQGRFKGRIKPVGLVKQKIEEADQENQGGAHAT